ncbi:MAG TPA: hypothetical protein VMX56_01350 [Anaerolineales bacterium]|nr:hypothetical protein [Anaerolineales bacterium]
MTFKRLVLGITFLAISAMAVRASVGYDTWWHLKAGEWMLANREILRIDLFSLTRQGSAWIYPGWLAQIILYAAFQTFSFAGLNLFTALMVVAAFAFVWCTLEGRDLLKAFIILLAASASGVYWSARPQIISFALAGYFLFVLYSSRKGRERLLWSLPLAMIFWVNVHGGFAIGFLILGVYLCGEIVQLVHEVVRGDRDWGSVWEQHKREIFRLLSISLLCALAVMINPHGPQMILYPLKTVSIQVLQDYIQEWQSPNFHQAEVLPFLLMLLLVIGTISGSSRKVDPTELLLVLVFLALALLASRNIALFALVAAPFITRHLDAVLDDQQHEVKAGPQLMESAAKWVNLTIFLLLFAASGIKISSALSSQSNQDGIEAEFPVRAVEYLRDFQTNKNLFNSYNWGGYVIWELHPDFLSFVDGRTDLFDDEILEDYIVSWQGLAGWEQVFEKWDIKMALIEPWAPLRVRLESQGWVIDYEDELAVVISSPK